MSRWLMPAMAQDSAFANVLTMEVKGYGGALMNIHPQFPEKKMNALLEFNIGWATQGERDWHADHGFPETGISLTYTNFGNSEVLGYSLAMLPYVTFRNKKSDPAAAFEFRMAAGGAWFNHPYNFRSNPENVVIGSRFAAIINLCPSLYLRLNQHFTCTIGTAFTHFSNGHTAVPNVGANIFSVNSALRHYRKPIHHFRSDNLETVNQKLKLNLRLGLGWHEAESTVKVDDGPMYRVYALSLFFSRRMDRIHNLQAGLYGHYYTFFHDLILDEDIFDKDRQLISTAIIAFLGDEIYFGRVSLVLNMGYNVYQPFTRYLRDQNRQERGWTSYHLSGKFGLQYYPFYPIDDNGNKIYVGIYLKSIAGKADFTEIGFGYTF